MFDATRAARQAVCAAILVLVAAPLGAQNHRMAAGLTGGWAGYSDMTPGLEATELAAGWTAGAQLEAWLSSGRFGARLNGAYTRRPLEGDEQISYDVFMGDVGALFRPLPAGRARWVAPFLSLGGGLAVFRGGEGAPLGGGSYGADPVIRPLVTGGIGADFLPYRKAGLRLEISDKVVFPSVGESPEASGLPTVHNLAVTTAVQLRIGQMAGGQSSVVDAPVMGPRSQRMAASSASGDEVERLQVLVEMKDEEIRSLETRIAELERSLAAARSAQQPAREPAAAQPQASRSSSAVSEPARRGGPLGTPLGTPVARATPPRPAVQPAARAATPQSGELYTVQVGAFVEAPTAARWVERLREKQLPVWLVKTELQDRTLTRVRVGALVDTSEAEQLARILERDYGWSVRVERVEPGESLPNDAVRTTRAFLQGL